MYQRVADQPIGQYLDEKGNVLLVERCNKDHPERSGYASLCPASAWALGSKVYRPMRDPDHLVTPFK